MSMTAWLSQKVVQDMRQYAAVASREKLYECLQWLGESHEILREDHAFLAGQDKRQREEIELQWDRLRKYTEAHSLLRKAFGELLDIKFNDNPVYFAKLICEKCEAKQ